jgi:hypothetical protein
MLAQAMLDHFHVGAGRDQQRRVAMPEIMEAETLG